MPIARVPCTIALLLLGLSTPLRGEDVAAAEALDLLDVVAEETALVTRLRANADYVPGIVSVLRADELAALGARTVGDAIALVPGLQANRDSFGLPLYFARGIPFFDSAGGFKVLVDGLTVSQENSGISGAVLLMALEQVERIEVIRGPGSGIWGDYAFVGLINIISRKDRNQAWFDLGSRELRSVGAAAHAESDEARIALTLSDQQTRGNFSPDVPGPDGSAQGRREVDTSVLTLDAAWREFELTGSAVRRDFGLTTPPPRFPTDESSWVLRGTRRWAFAPGQDLGLWLEAGHHDIRIPAISYDARQWRAGLDLNWQQGVQQWLLRAVFADHAIERAVFVPPGPRPVNFVVDDLNQYLSSLVVQDSIALGRALTLTAGLRHDRHRDIGEHTAPRLALVWQAADGHTLKAQYAEGLRAPTFQYLYDVQERPLAAVEFEVVRTFDLGYVYRRAGRVARATLFHSEFDNLRLPPPPYRRGASARAQGLELEWEQTLNQRLKLLANASFVDPRDRRPSGLVDADSVGYARWVGNLALLGRLPADLAIGLHWNHVGSRDIGPRQADGYDLVNLSLSWEPTERAWALRGRVRNALDQRIAAVYSFVGRLQQPAWDGRLYELQWLYRFD